MLWPQMTAIHLENSNLFLAGDLNCGLSYLITVSLCVVKGSNEKWIQFIKKLYFFLFYFSSTGLMFVGLHFLYLWLPRWLWAEAILWWLEKSDSSIWGRSGGLLPPRGYPNYPCFVQISRQRHLCASSERSKTFGHCVLAQRYCCQKSSHTTLESYTLSVTCQVRTETIV